MLPGYTGPTCGAPYTPDNQSIAYHKPASAQLNLMYQHWPEWQHAMKIASQCMASLSLNNCHKGMGVFFTNFQNQFPGERTKTLLIPKHLIEQDTPVYGNNLQQLISEIRIHLPNDPVAYEVRLLEDGNGVDYCLLAIKGDGIASPVRISYSNLAYDTPYMYAEMGKDSCEIFITLVSLYLDMHTSQIMFKCVNQEKTEWTQPGSCGGIYLDQSGELVGIHLGRSNGNGRVFLSANSVVKISEKITTLDQGFNPVKDSSNINPSPPVNYIQEKDVRVSTKENAQGYFCRAREIHMTNAQRGLKIDVYRKVMDVKTKKLKECQQSCVKYQVFLVDANEAERPNIHNNKGSPSSYTNESALEFYQTMVQKFQNNISTLGVQPDSFEFVFRKFTFIGRKINSQ